MERFLVYVRGVEQPIGVQYNMSVEPAVLTVGGAARQRASIELILKDGFGVDVLAEYDKKKHSFQWTESRPRDGIVRFALNLPRKQFIDGINVLTESKFVQVVETKALGRVMR